MRFHGGVMMTLRRAGMIGLVALPAGLTLYFGFNDGGFYPGTQAFATIVLLLALAARLIYAEQPLSGISRPAGLAAIALVLYALLTLASAVWSDSPARALLEFNRVLLYLSALALFATLPRHSSRMNRMVWTLAFAFAIVAGAGLLTRLLPETFPTSTNLQNNRLSYPLNYWNALGVLAALGTALCFHLACRARGPVALRVLGAAAVPMLATTVLFTFSRGAIVAGTVGLVVYVIVARPRGLPSGLLATLPLSVVAVKTGYGADALATTTPTTPEAVDQGRDVARTVAACMVGAALVRLPLVLLDGRIAAIRISERARRRGLRPAVAAAALCAVIVAVAAGFPGYVDRQYERFAEGDQAEFRGDFRERLGDPASPARQRQWRVAVREFRRSELRGSGAGTYQLAWQRRRPDPSTVVDAHSLYLEVLGELGLAGILFVGVAIGAILAGLLWRARGRDRPLYGALFAAGIAWALHAGVDWDWEMPALTLWLFALGGAALARPQRENPRRVVPPYLRLGAGLALLALTLVPTLIAMSQERLDSSAAAFERRDCPTASREAKSAISTLGVRPEPYEILGYCHIRGRRPREAVAQMRKAVDRDPRNWNYHYSLAVAQAAAGRDPRAEAKKARSLNPLEPLTRDLVRRFRTTDRRLWRRRALAVAESFIEV
jgi:O-antigen ligase